MRIVLVFIALFAGNLASQTSGTTCGQTWQIPFGSEGNTISLSVANNASIEARNVSVTFTNLPSWLEFKSNSVMLKSIPAKSTEEAEFTFSADKKAPVGKDTTLTAVISTRDGQSWTKDITVSVGAPKDYKLYNNFPNPFNPSTKIAFELPKASRVTLTIYDVLGREVAEIADRNYPAGYSELTWNGMNRKGEEVSSGVYFYRITAGKWSMVMKMMSLK
ncbi:MAG: T9SS type A sorting domain-containing protein [Bacteroidetes bacterium]|nr:T9SS type A sorting domain-containing protein [Bacteroidota bacterium]